MNFAQQEEGGIKKFLGFSIVLLLHALLFYSLVTGLAKTMVDVIKKPIETKIITEEIKPPPEVPKPPPPSAKTPPPTLPFVPPPEVAAPPQPEQETMATSSVPADPNPSPAPAAPADTSAQSAPQPAIVDLNACKPDYPKSALMNEETGIVRLRFVIGADGQLVSASVLKSSGFKDLDKAAVAALSHCQFKAAMQDGAPIQSAFTSDYVWKMD